MNRLGDYPFPILILVRLNSRIRGKLKNKGHSLLTACNAVMSTGARTNFYFPRTTMIENVKGDEVRNCIKANEPASGCRL